MEKIQKLFGEHLRKLRKGTDIKGKKVSQEKLADISGLTTQYIGELERGEKNPSLETLYKLSKGLKMALPQLLSLEDLAESEQEKIYALIDGLSASQRKDVLKVIGLMIKQK